MLSKAPGWQEYYHGYWWAEIWEYKCFAVSMMKTNETHYFLGKPFVCLLKWHERYHQWTRKNDRKKPWSIMFGAGDGLWEKFLLLTCAWWMTLIHRVFAGSWYAEPELKDLEQAGAVNE